MAEVRTCPECGEECFSANVDDVMRCPNCGAPVPPPEKGEDG